MTNIEQYINNGTRCHHPSSITPSIDCSNLNIPKKISEYLLLENFLSEYNTELEKKLVMQNILLLDKIPTEGSTNLLNSDTVFRVMRENKSLIDQLTTLINNLQNSKVDKSNTYTKDEIDSQNNSKVDKSDVYTKEEVNEIVEDLQQHGIDLTEYYTKQQIQQILNDELSGKADLYNLSEVALSGDYNDLQNRPINVSQLVNDAGYLTEQQEQLQSDWNQTNTSSKDYIKNKPTNISQFTNDSGYLTQHQDISQKADKSEVQKFIIISESEYESLTEYVKDTVYLVLEDEEHINTSWKFGDKLPIILSGNWKFGDGLPIILN